MPRPILLALAALLAASLVACGGESSAPASDATSAVSTDVVPVDEAERLIDDGARVIDVRTPEEFEAGHLPGAVNVDYEADDFDEEIAELPRDASYVVYCASGRRASGAVETMVELGFDDVVNGGGYDDLASLG